MRMNLKVPFAEKDEAKRLGARWDAARKVWYIDGKVDAASFARWAPVPHEATADAVPAAARAGAAAAGIVQVGSRYVDRPRVCDCLPWEDCDRCRQEAGRAG